MRAGLQMVRGKLRFVQFWWGRTIDAAWIASQSVAEDAAGRVSRGVRGCTDVAFTKNFSLWKCKEQLIFSSGRLHDARLRVSWMWINGWSIWYVHVGGQRAELNLSILEELGKLNLQEVQYEVAPKEIITGVCVCVCESSCADDVQAGGLEEDLSLCYDLWLDSLSDSVQDVVSTCRQHWVYRGGDCIDRG